MKDFFRNFQDIFSDFSDFFFRIFFYFFFYFFQVFGTFFRFFTRVHEDFVSCESLDVRCSPEFDHYLPATDTVGSNRSDDLVVPGIEAGIVTENK